MSSTAFTTDQYNALCAALAQGTLSVEYSDKKVTYRSLNEMLQLRNLMANELGIVTSNRGGRFFAEFSKGLDC